MESTPGEDVVKTVQMTTEDSQYYMNFIDKGAAGFETTGSNFGRSSTVGKCYQPASHAAYERNTVANFVTVFKDVPS